MGLALSCPGGDALDERLEALIMRSLNGANVKTTLRSVSFNGRGSEPAAILKAFGSGKLIFEGSLSFKMEDNADSVKMETKISITSPKGNPMKQTFRASRFSPATKERALESPIDCPKHNAAVKLQKVYKSFRTRRQLADCAILVEQRWWKLLDFAMLKQSSVSFFDVDEPESVVSRWLRARRRAALVGKGLSKDEKAQKLALQHWLEAIDPRHRYGHNLHFYYDCWLQCESNEPFFYWLDLGEGKEVTQDQCSRSKLQHQCIKYLGPAEREVYEVVLEDAKFLYKTSRKILDTSEGPEHSKWIFVLSTTKTLYVGQKKKGTFQHSSFLAGGATSAAGRLVVENGILKAVWPHSGHYRPTKQNFQEFMNFLKENNVDLTDVKLTPTEDDEEPTITQADISTGTETGLDESYASTEARNPSPQKDTIYFESSSCANISSTEFRLEKLENSSFSLETNRFSKLKKAKSSEIPRELLSGYPADIHAGRCNYVLNSPMSEAHYKHNLFKEEQDEEEEEASPEELILRRIKSKKGMDSYQLGKQLSCKWTTGAGPRIGFVRDYPSEIQFRSLEQVHLSPRIQRPYPSPRLPSHPSPRVPSIPASPRIPEYAFSRKVPLLQKPKMRR